MTIGDGGRRKASQGEDGRTLQGTPEDTERNEGIARMLSFLAGRGALSRSHRSSRATIAKVTKCQERPAQRQLHSIPRPVQRRGGSAQGRPRGRGTGAAVTPYTSRV